MVACTFVPCRHSTRGLALFRHHRLFATLTLIALLTSNVIGWMHVGCHSAAGGAHASLGEHAHGEAFAASAHHCCHHHSHTTASGPERLCSPASSGENSAAGGASSTPLSFPGSDGDRDHDSDSCHICQDFLVTRQAIVLAESPSVERAVITGVQRPRHDSIVPERALGSGLSVRGPPRV